MSKSELVTICISLLGSAFLAGTAWGRLKSIDKRLESIERLFTLQLRKTGDDQR